MKDSAKSELVQGVVEESLPGTTFRVRLSTGETILAYISGRMRIHRIKILPGDSVVVEMTSYDRNRGRITRRL
ncbi:MAG: translation initiation factor IF-1 [Candidatus Colwellbacteria bacterium RIFCSPHIGHO2_12_FULL_44_17]|uniref:Translation initiation factor IF-1 n=2 Tax=Candidatus Colwelliibacteriota TaxID=1817904 RepID=A0A1G1Z651_9BACT|nr:MAG: translation initiation factor IF-1 [Candidatus Colwellbacteria bacterium RIFCSPHIGHO2_12_FULL_44_17]OGY60108.1 MAG: translation initiation factor IF-1 [Candidatus Colwellbacteria bacterium RIFCSPLOWO2_02_FULL_44_20b]